MTLRQLMPAWVGWLGPAAIVAVVVVWVLLVPGLVLWLVRRRLRRELHWTERAGLATEGRTAILLGNMVWPIASIGLVGLFGGPFSLVPARALFAFVDIAAPLASIAMAWWFSGRVLDQPVPSFRSYLWLTVRKWWPLVAILLVSFFAPPRLTSPWMIPWTVVALAALHGLSYLIDLYVATGVAAPAEGRVLEAVTRAAGRHGSTMPDTFVATSHAANAFALPRRNIIIMTRRLVDLLDDTELEAVALHEVAHLNERRAVTRRRTWANFLLLPILAIRPLLAAGVPVLVGVLLITLIVRRQLTRMTAAEETRADHEAAELSHESTAFGTALLKMHQAALIPAFVRRDPHGPLHDRLVRAGVTPDWEPIVKAPRMRRLQLAVVASMLLLIAASLVPAFTFDRWDGERGSHVAVAFGWQTEQVLGHTGYLTAYDGDYTIATVYLQEAVNRGDASALSDLAWALAASGDCVAAREAHFELVQRGGDAEDLDWAGSWVSFCYQQQG